MKNAATTTADALDGHAPVQWPRLPHGQELYSTDEDDAEGSEPGERRPDGLDALPVVRVNEAILRGLLGPLRGNVKHFIGWREDGWNETNGDAQVHADLSLLYFLREAAA